jgi:hypothetical protein
VVAIGPHDNDYGDLAAAGAAAAANIPDSEYKPPSLCSASVGDAYAFIPSLIAVSGADPDIAGGFTTASAPAHKLWKVRLPIDNGVAFPTKP